MKILKITIWVVLALFVILQFIPNTYPENKKSNEHDLILTGDVTQEVGLILKNSCYDCHSNETRYPWYAYIAPVSWLVVRDVKLGRAELNFSEWDNLKSRDKIKLLDEIAEEVEVGNMPMPIYTITHGDAALGDDKKQLLAEWTENMMNDILGE
ncbi:MAG: heme-binding domain-containing protein [Cyclobacteriaceae bacterium]|jgi:hypothetical protein